MSFLGKGYELPKTASNYMKLQSGDNKFRIVSSAIVGYEYWNTENKPVRLKTSPQGKPGNVRMNDDDSYTVKHFWAFAVLDRWDGKIKVLELTQSTIMKSIKSLVDNEDWGDPKGYDININRTGEKLTTEYTVQPSPHKELSEEEKELVKKTPVNLDALFSGGNPFEESEAIDVSDIAF